jgi:hypothetical protein
MAATWHPKEPEPMPVLVSHKAPASPELTSREVRDTGEPMLVEFNVHGAELSTRWVGGGLMVHLEPMLMQRILMAKEVGFQLEARELGNGLPRRHDVAPGELCVAGAGGTPTELGWRSRGHARTLEVVRYPGCTV